MDAHRLPKGLGWLSVGLGLTKLTFAEGICRLLGLKGHAGVVRALGARELVTGLGLLSQPERRPWLWGRVAGDAIDLSVLGTTLNRSTAATSAWRFAATVAVLGITLIDVYAASAPRIRRVSNSGKGDRWEGPLESWRGSGLAEDVGANANGAGAEWDEAKRHQMMQEAQSRLGLPDPENLTPRR
ncbi:hypothetical protein [Stigmatella aurantiaca]|uniref:Uncharacterized protein n=1 Tax=Stigmatella aurantiaca (strain DW4/3-1) TaxID=378806 RepID=Q096T9_STIAD|nr:hypothetical protein [Stigmatella aurantiaca]EAU67739.1 conserved hypothetical protein [Stigmatella aurantiaca DW4/3-1]